jgi:hypothetical protein
MSIEKRSFRMDPQLLFDVIQRQAGSISKALLEGIMNSVDAGATECIVKISPTFIEITDDGRGFRSKNEIESFFEVFGKKHDASEKKIYGTFRMGRGQMFAFGVNSWETHGDRETFKMKVDIKHEGLDYHLEVLPKTGQKGCSIHIDLYRHLLPSDLNGTIREIEKMAKYAPLKLTINGTQVSVDPDTEKWDEITDDAYIRLRETTSLAIYNLGVWVKDFGNYTYGCGGTVVSRKQLVLNFARNDLMVNECAVWRRIKKIVDQRATTKNKRKPILDDGERERLATQVVTGEIGRAEAKTLKIFTDVCGKHWSAEQIARCKQGDTATFAEKGDLLGDQLMQNGVCFVFAKDNLDRFGLTEIKLVNLINTLAYWKPKLIRFSEATKGMDAKCILLDKKQWSTREKVFVDLLNACYCPLMWYLPNACNTNRQEIRREILIGSSKSALAWTDGERYIVFAREYLHGLFLDLKGLLNLFDTCLHEYCHDSSDAGTHLHSLEFYQAYHDAREGSNYAAVQAFKMLGAVVEKHGLRLNKWALQMMDAEAKAKQAVAKNRAVAGADRPEDTPMDNQPVAAKAIEVKPEVKPTAPSGENPYRATSHYGILFDVGSQRFWERESLLATVAKTIGKDVKLVANDLAVLTNPKHQSNKNRSILERDVAGNIKLVKI